MQTDRVEVNANDVVAFLVEMVVLGLLAWAGFAADATLWLRLLLGIGLPLVAAVLWGLFAAPRARISSPPLRLATKLLVLGAGVLAGFLVLPAAWAAAFAVVVVVNLVLMYVGPLARAATVSRWPVLADMRMWPRWRKSDASASRITCACRRTRRRLPGRRTCECA